MGKLIAFYLLAPPLFVAAVLLTAAVPGGVYGHGFLFDFALLTVFIYFGAPAIIIALWGIIRVTATTQRVAGANEALAMGESGLGTKILKG